MQEQSELAKSGFEGWGESPALASLGEPLQLQRPYPGTLSQEVHSNEQVGGACGFKPRGPPGISSAGTRHSRLKRNLKGMPPMPQGCLSPSAGNIGA